MVQISMHLLTTILQKEVYQMVLHSLAFFHLLHEVVVHRQVVSHLQLAVLDKGPQIAKTYHWFQSQQVHFELVSLHQLLAQLVVDELFSDHPYRFFYSEYVHSDFDFVTILFPKLLQHIFVLL